MDSFRQMQSTFPTLARSISLRLIPKTARLATALKELV
jgi:hypothetical protein